jgi:TolA-binding protein
MIIYKKILQTKLIFIFTLFTGLVFADSHDINEVLELIKKDIKTLEKAVYSNSSDSVSSSDNKKLSNNSEDVLTRHLLKLSEIENQFRELTNKFEEMNFKLDKLSSRLSKVQADNQLRFQEIENFLSSDEKKENKNFKKKVKKIEALPGSSQPQDLGSISYKGHIKQ